MVSHVAGTISMHNSITYSHKFDIMGKNLRDYLFVFREKERERETTNGKNNGVSAPEAINHLK